MEKLTNKQENVLKELKKYMAKNYSPHKPVYSAAYEKKHRHRQKYHANLPEYGSHSRLSLPIIGSPQRIIGEIQFPYSPLFFMLLSIWQR